MKGSGPDEVTDPGSRRDFPRIPIELRVDYEFVKWTETELDGLTSARQTTSFDLSASGLGLVRLPDLDQGMKKQLLTGLKKVRLALYLNPDLRVILFARLIWSQLDHSHVIQEGRAGFVFLDIPVDKFWILKRFVEDRLHS